MAYVCLFVCFYICRNVFLVCRRQLGCFTGGKFYKDNIDDNSLDDIFFLVVCFMRISFLIVCFYICRIVFFMMMTIVRMTVAIDGNKDKS